MVLKPRGVYIHPFFLSLTPIQVPVAKLVGPINIMVPILRDFRRHTTSPTWKLCSCNRKVNASDHNTDTQAHMKARTRKHGYLRPV